MAMTVSYDQRSYLRLQERLQTLTLPKDVRKKVLGEIGRYEKKKTKADMRKQRTPDGKAWEKRHKGKGKMFKKLPKHIKFKQEQNNWAVNVGWFDGKGIVANEHQQGLPQNFRSYQLGKENKKKGINPEKMPATRAQAKELKGLGYKVKKYQMTEQDMKDHSRELDSVRREILKKNGGFHNPEKFKLKMVTPTIKWIVANLTMAQASKEISKLEGQKIKTAWLIKRPKRELLGVSPRRVAIIIKKELKRQAAS